MKKNCSPLRMNLKHGGIVPGEKNGNRDTVPAMLTPKEAVLPVDTVEALGGPAAVRDLIARTHTPTGRHGLRDGMANGGFVFTGSDEASDAEGLSVEAENRAQAAARRTPKQKERAPIEMREGGIVPFGPLEEVRTPSTALAQRPYQPNFTMGGNGVAPDLGRSAIPPNVANPSVPPGGSTEARAWQNRNVIPNSGPQMPGPVSPRTMGEKIIGSADDWQKWGDTAKSRASTAIANTGRLTSSGAGSALASVAKKVMPGVSQAAGAYEMIQGARDGDGGQIALGAADTIAGMALATPAAPLAGAYLGVRGLYEGGKAAVEFGRNLNDKTRENIGGGLNSVMRHFGGGVNDDALQTVNAMGPNFSGARPSAAPLASGPANPTDQRLAAGTQTTPMNPGVPGREVSGAEGIRRIGNLYTDGSKGGSVSTVGGGAEGMRQNNMEADRLVAARTGQEAEFQTNKSSSEAFTAMVQANMDSERGGRNAGVRSTLAPTGNLQMRGQEMDARAREVAGQASAAARRDGVTARGQELGSADNARRDSVTLRGQDMLAATEGKRIDATARSAAVTAQRDQMNKDRQFGMDEKKYGADEAKTRFDQRGKSIDEFSKRVDGMVPAGADGKPDVAGKARVMESANRMVVERTDELKAFIQKNPNSPKAAQAAKELDDIERQGIGILGEKQLRQLSVGDAARGVAEQGGAFSFGSQSGSTGPVTTLKKQSGMMGDYYTTNRPGDEIPAGRIDMRGGLNFGPWNIGGRPNDDFKALK